MFYHSNAPFFLFTEKPIIKENNLVWLSIYIHLFFRDSPTGDNFNMMNDDPYNVSEASSIMRTKISLF